MDLCKLLTGDINVQSEDTFEPMGTEGVRTGTEPGEEVGGEESSHVSAMGDVDASTFRQLHPSNFRVLPSDPDSGVAIENWSRLPPRFGVSPSPGSSVGAGSPPDT